MHFAPIPHQYRHVLGWYRLAKELEDSGVSAICVFDGKERNLAKAREVRHYVTHPISTLTGISRLCDGKKLAS